MASAATTVAAAPDQNRKAGSPPQENAPADARAAGDIDDYNQWKRALEGDPTDPTSITAPPGYRVERVRTAAEGEGSWISIDFDPRGRLVIAKEDKGLLNTLDRDEILDLLAYLISGGDARHASFRP
jgi:hypothetical protein